MYDDDIITNVEEKMNQLIYDKQNKPHKIGKLTPCKYKKKQAQKNLVKETVYDNNLNEYDECVVTSTRHPVEDIIETLNIVHIKDSEIPEYKHETKRTYTYLTNWFSYFLKNN